MVAVSVSHVCARKHVMATRSREQTNAKLEPCAAAHTKVGLLQRTYVHGIRMPFVEQLVRGVLSIRWMAGRDDER